MNLPRFSVHNPVAANLLMWAVLLSGVYYWFTMLREFFPNIEPEQVYIKVLYPGATPEEVEKTVTRKIEREIEDVRDVKKIESQIVEGFTLIVVSMERGADRTRVINDLRGEIDKVKPELPADAEDPEIVEVRPFIPVIAVVIFGDVAEETLRREAITVKEDFMAMPEISQVVLIGMRKKEIWVEVRLERLEEFGLTFEEVGRALAQANLDVPGGQLKSRTGNIRVRTMGESDRARVIEQIVVKSRPDGTAIRLSDVAQVRETFEDKIEKGRYAQKNACSLTIFKAPEQDALKIAKTVKAYVARNPTRLGGALQLKTKTDLSRYITQRLDLMFRNAKSGFILVVICLAMFLDLRVALWVAWGVPTALLGSFVVMHFWGLTINLMSLFAIILVLGMLVDDAIVVGENVYTKMQQGIPLYDAAIDGANEVAMPVVASVTTTIAAFIPLMFIEGMTGKFLAVLPVVVIAALTVSMLEAFLILPAHLAHRHDFHVAQRFPRFAAFADRVARFRDNLIEVKMAGVLEIFLRILLRWRYATVAGVIGFAIFVAGLVAADIIPFVLFPKIDAENVSINLEMVAGTSEEITMQVVAELEQMALSYPEVDSVISIMGASFSDRGQDTNADPATVGQVNLEMVTSETREVAKQRNTLQVINDMRRKATKITGIKKLEFISQSGGPSGGDIELRVQAEDLAMLARAVPYLREEIRKYEGVTEIEDNLKQGKQEIQVRLKDSAATLGLSTRTIALQVRHALFGFEAQRLQEETEEVRVRVILPETARRNMASLSLLRITTPTGARVPLDEVAELTTARGYATLSRADGKRAVTIKAQVDEERGNVSQITEDLVKRFADIGSQFPGVTLAFEGRRKEARESLGSLAIGFPAALLMIYAILAVLFRSYTQPIIIMTAIPYSFVGVVLGHWFMNYPVTLMSLIGMVALAGVVVNDSLVMVDFINRMRAADKPLFEVVVAASKSRLRAILLTSVTTIFGLAPLMFETSLQARFLIPMAISLVYGLGFATILTLIVIPALYLMLEDFHKCTRWFFTGKW